MKKVQVATRVPENIREEALQILKKRGLTLSTFLRMNIYELTNTRCDIDNNTQNNKSLAEKQEKFSAYLRKKYDEGKISKLEVNERGAIVIPKGHPLDKGWIREAWKL